MELAISGVIGLLFGSVIAWLALRSRSAALSARLSLTEKELTAEKADLARLLQDQGELIGARARLESALESERKTSNEKMELVTRAGENLQNAFKAMASDALKSNNSSFLQIAQETLKRFQSEAKGDLEARQKAVADMVAPVRDSLNKVDAQIQQMEMARGEAYGDLTRAGAIPHYDAERVAIGNRQPGAGPAHAQCARTLGRNPVAARSRDRRHAFLLRLRRAGNGHRRKRALCVRIWS